MVIAATGLAREGRPVATEEQRPGRWGIVSVVMGCLAILCILGWLGLVLWLTSMQDSPPPDMGTAVWLLLAMPLVAQALVLGAWVFGLLALVLGIAALAHGQVVTGLAGLGLAAATFVLYLSLVTMSGRAFGDTMREIMQELLNVPV